LTIFCLSAAWDRELGVLRLRTNWSLGNLGPLWSLFVPYAGAMWILRQSALALGFQIFHQEINLSSLFCSFGHTGIWTQVGRCSTTWATSPVQATNRPYIKVFDSFWIDIFAGWTTWVQCQSSICGYPVSAATFVEEVVFSPS
jgi:hypothetical protein